MSAVPVTDAFLYVTVSVPLEPLATADTDAGLATLVNATLAVLDAVPTEVTPEATARLTVCVAVPEFVMLTDSMPVVLRITVELAATLEETFSVSVPAPPLRESDDESVIVLLLMGALKVSLPDVPVNAAPESIPVVSGQINDFVSR